MEVMRSYVVRIYREDSDSLTGLIESAETGESFAFRSIEELRAALSRPPCGEPFNRTELTRSADQETDTNDGNRCGGDVDLRCGNGRQGEHAEGRRI